MQEPVRGEQLAFHPPKRVALKHCLPCLPVEVAGARVIQAVIAYFVPVAGCPAPLCDARLHVPRKDVERSLDPVTIQDRDTDVDLRRPGVVPCQADRRALATGPAKRSGGQVLQSFGGNVVCAELAAGATNAFVTAAARVWADA